MKTSLRLLFVLILGLIGILDIVAQTTETNLSSPYVRPRADDDLGAWFIYTPSLDTMDATPTDDTIFYYFPNMKIYNQFDLYGAVTIDTTAGNLGANAGTISIQQNPCLSGCDRFWNNVDTDNLPAQGADVELTGIVNGQRLRIMIIATAGNFAPFFAGVLKRE